MPLNATYLRSCIPIPCRRPCGLRGTSTHRGGAVVVEFAVAAPVFFLLLFVAIEFSRLNMTRHAADNAAYEAARHAVVPGATTAEAAAKANEHLSIFGFQACDVTVNPIALADANDEVTVTVDIPMDQNSWLLPVFTQGRHVVSTTTLRTERYHGVQ